MTSKLQSEILLFLPIFIKISPISSKSSILRIFFFGARPEKPISSGFHKAYAQKYITKEARVFWTRASRKTAANYSPNW